MAPTEHLVAFVAMALAILTVLAVGTLAAADILRIGRREPAAKPPQAAEPNRVAHLREAFGASDARTDPRSTSHSKEVVTSAPGNGNAHR